MEQKKRFLFVDLLRGWALLVMIEVHVFNSMLQTDLLNSSWFGILNFINGLVAPSFLFVSGFAFVLSTKNQTEELRKFGNKFWKKLGRIVLILLAGYSIHLPILSLRRFINFYSPDVIISFYNVDILQCIAISLLIVFIGRIILKSDKHFLYFQIIGLIAVLILSPVIWNIKFEDIILSPFAAYFNNDLGSNFPLFPWITFIFAGGISANYYIRSRANNNEKSYINYLFVVGFLSAAIGIFYRSGFFPNWFGTLRPQPFFVIERLGYVLILTRIKLALHRMEKNAKIGGNRSRERIVANILAAPSNYL